MKKQAMRAQGHATIADGAAGRVESGQVPLHLPHGRAGATSEHAVERPQRDAGVLDEPSAGAHAGVAAPEAVEQVAPTAGLTLPAPPIAQTAVVTGSVVVAAPTRREVTTGWALAGVATSGLLAVQLGTSGSPEIGELSRLGLMFALILYGSWTVSPSARALGWSLAVLPLARLLAIGLPLDVLPTLYQVVAVGLPVAIAATVAAWAIGYSWRDLGIRVTWRSLASVPVLVALGWGVGIAQHAAGIGAPVAASLAWNDLWLPMLLVVLSSSFADELLYRGVLQRAATSLFGWAGLIWSAAIYTVVHVGQVPAGELPLVFVLGLAFAVCTRLTGSILGAVVGHAALDVAASVVGPLR